MLDRVSQQSEARKFRDHDERDARFLADIDMRDGSVVVGPRDQREAYDRGVHRVNGFGRAALNLGVRVSIVHGPDNGAAGLQSHRTLSERLTRFQAASYLEERLTSALKARFVSNNTVHNKVFKNYGPLSTFTAKIDIAYLLKIFPEQGRASFHTIREIRNRFAHRLDVNSFDDEPVSDLCKKLYRPENIKKIADQLKALDKKEDETYDQRDLFIFAFSGLQSLPDTARNAYMSTVKIILLDLSIGTAFAIQDEGAIAPRIFLTPWPQKS